MSKKAYPLLLFILVMASCKNNVHKTTFPNGETYQVIEILPDSTRHGKYIEYNESGSLAEEASYDNGKLIGERLIYYPSGNIRIKESYNQGEFNGPYVAYYEDGTPKLEMVYEHNLITGLSKAYFPSGTLKEEVTFSNNEENGPFKEYHANGGVSWKGNYRNGDKEFGLLEEFDSTGVLIKKMMCDSIGVCRTIWTPETGDITPEPIEMIES